MKRKANAVWTGTLKEGRGTLTTESGALSQQPYTFVTRFEEGVTGSNPEELLAAAEAGCFTMALNNDLTMAGHQPVEVRTEATTELNRIDGKPTITHVHLVTRARVPGIDQATFQKFAEDTRNN